jgi:NDP-sugar pyrophosphorylase family protein
MPGAYLFDDNIIIGAGTVIEPGALIKGPTVIGANTEVRQGAYMRGNCLVGNGCVVGHTTEIKGSIMLDGAKAGHFAYIGDSILGKDVNLGAGTKLANLKMIPGKIIITVDRKFHNTGRRKLGAILGDRTETGCNSVTSPGTLMEPRSIVYSGITVAGGYYQKSTCVMPSRSSVEVLSDLFENHK